MNNREKYDAVTVGQIRARQMLRLKNLIQDLSTLLIDKGYFSLHEAAALLKGDIAQVLTEMQNLDSWASTEAMFPPTKETK